MMTKSEPIQIETDSLVGQKFIHPPVETGASIMKIIANANHNNANFSHLTKTIS